jgi:hypothetical protein
MVRLHLAALGAVVLLSPAALATTWIVNASGGGNFTDIQTAIGASQPGDVLLVQPGTYAPFALDRGLSIIGYGACNVSGTITIAGVPAAQTAALVRIEAALLDIQGCDGTVLVQDTQQLQSISVASSPDVRFARVVVPVGTPSLTPLEALVLSDSRLEAVSSNIRGGSGLDCATPDVDGRIGVNCSNSRLHMSRSSLVGGFGSSCAAQNYGCGDGADGLELLAGSEAIVCGRALDRMDGGEGGVNFYYLNDCSYDGFPGYAVGLVSGTLRHSGVTIGDFLYYYGIHCVPITGYGVQNLGGTEIVPALPDPTLSVSGGQAAGSMLSYSLDAPAGSTALLYLGRKPTVLPDPNTEIEVLTLATCVVNLGQVPAGGTVTYNWRIPSVLTPGVTFYAQAEVSVAPGDLRRTNSIPVIVR